MPRNPGCGPIEEALDNAELFITSARTQIKLARRLVNDPTVMNDRVEQAKKKINDNITSALRELRDLTTPDTD